MIGFIRSTFKLLTPFFVCGILFFFVATHVSAKGNTATKAGNKTFSPKKNPIKVDDFKDGNFSNNPDWWNFGQVSMVVVDNSSDIKSMKKSKSKIKLGRKSLQVRGFTQRYYAGGVGVYLGLDGFDYSKLVLRIYSPEVNAGIIRFELYDDDNGNNRVDFGLNNDKPDSDDLLVYNLTVNWVGWKTVRVPMEYFEDDNPHVGDNVFNPYRINRSAGLVQMQMVFLSRREPEKELMFKFDYIGFE